MFKTGKRQAITILARISGLVNDRGDYFIFSTMPVFLIGIFIGTEKPVYDRILAAFVSELLLRHPGRCSQFLAAVQARIPARFSKYLAAQATISRPWPNEHFPEEDSQFPSIFVALDRNIADAPARSDLTGTPGPNGYWSLPRCGQRGRHITNQRGKKGHMEFELIHCSRVLRTDNRWNSYKKLIKPFPDDTPAMIKKIKVITTFSVCHNIQVYNTNQLLG